MEINQAVSILSQAIDVAVASGSFKSSKDVAVVNLALEITLKFVKDNTDQVKEPELSVVPTGQPKSKSKS
jgi:hypothetical protein